MDALLFPNVLIFAALWVAFSTIAIGCMVLVRMLFRKLFTRKSVIGSYLEV